MLIDFNGPILYSVLRKVLICQVEHVPPSKLRRQCFLYVYGSGVYQGWIILTIGGKGGKKQALRLVWW